ncbi:putative gibberellin 3-beta [Phaeomoniella chlamydospora]|uniref:Putative gibberellin 3-beta n=1 Tax=Phaeomoniella chlamydospora TaxID=158046 RepID=A0A0G2ERY5_PHACM|nr:putative gibberellin 3-beta [Phaeomoniella chlamydospora]
MVLISKELLALYKEVQEYWEGGLQVPEDVTLLFAVDNFGSIRRLPVSTEASRRGRAGIYYHLEYVGEPRSYKWVNSNSCVLQLFDEDFDLSEEYHSMLGDKWNHMIRQPHYGYTDTWHAPYRDMIGGLCYVHTRQRPNPIVGEMGVAVEGTSGTRPGLTNEESDRTYPSRKDLVPGLTFPPLEPYGWKSRKFDIYRRGPSSIDWTIEIPFDWISLSETSGRLDEVRNDMSITIEVEWPQVPHEFQKTVQLELTSSLGDYEHIHLPVMKRHAPADFSGFVESDGRLETGAVALLPHAKASTTTSYLDYDFFTFTTPKTPVTLTLYFTLTLDIDPTNPLSYEVIIDDYSYGFHRLMEDPERAGLLPQGWNQAMQDCVWTKVIIVCGSTDTNDGREGTLPLLKLGKHRLKYRAWQENVVLEKMVLDLGGKQENLTPSLRNVCLSIIMAAPYEPPVSTIRKPEIPSWVPPEPSKCDLDWAQLHTIELSDLDSPDPSTVANLIATTKKAIKEDGFLYVTNYGVSLDQLHRQFDLAQYLHRNISQADKERLLWDPSSGLFAGFKPRTGWHREAGKFDGIEHFNFYAPQFSEPQNLVPLCILPFMDEITSFCTYLTQSVTRRLLILLSRVLELPETFLWDTIQPRETSSPVGEGYFRHALYYPLDEATRSERQAVRMYGHRDYGILTLLFSVPVTGLQVFSATDKKWRFVKYNPGALVVNLGEALEIISGGHFKATLHKVADTPPDQQHLQRLSLVLFNGARGDLRLAPAVESPLLQREGLVLEDEQGVFMQFKKLMDCGVKVPTNKEWREIQVSKGSQIPPQERAEGVKEINGVKYGTDQFLGVKVVLPV